MNLRKTILLTSFGGFPGAPVNPTQAISALAARQAGPRLARLGVRLECARLPVVFAEIAAALTAVQEHCHPQAILHLGLAANRRIATPETRAVNRVTLRHRDASGRLSAQRHAVKGGPDALRATLPAARLARVLQRSGTAAAPSRDAGGYVCNQTLYLSLLRANQCPGGSPLVGFIHVPLLRGAQRPCQRNSASAHSSRRPTLRALAQAIAACLVDTAAQLRGCRPA